MICFEESEAKYYREHQCQNFLSLPPIAHNKTQSLYTFISDSKAPSISNTYFYVLLLCSFPYFWQIEWIYFIGLQIFFTLSITYLMWPAAIITRQKKKFGFMWLLPLPQKSTPVSINIHWRDLTSANQYEKKHISEANSTLSPIQ